MPRDVTRDPASPSPPYSGYSPVPLQRKDKGTGWDGAPAPAARRGKQKIIAPGIGQDNGGGIPPFGAPQGVPTSSMAQRAQERREASANKRNPLGQERVETGWGPSVTNRRKPAPADGFPDAQPKRGRHPRLPKRTGDAP